ncbi:MAG TPA: sulfite exporter TauE/SafE family protein [Miltoncostaeaceae bacterium]|nr:sulfite exporter TauE/SafE family protein [Miltoncostaeaceae bacterium]
MRRVLVALVALAALLIGGAAVAAAHPLGNFTVNSYLRVEASGGELYLRQVVDMAEIPTFRERSAIDEAGGLQPYAAARARERAAEIELAVAGRRVAVEPVSQTAEVRPGQGGLRVLRYAAWYRAPGAASVARDGGRVDVSVPAYRDRLGWHELVVRPSSGAGVAGATVAERDVSDELRSYPEDRLSSPLTVTEASFTWSPGTGAGEVGPLTADPESRVEEDAPGGLAGLVDDDLSVGVVLLALVLAMGWGALHSLSPGHGKTMVAAYLVGARGRARHAFLLGLFVTVTHTIGVVALGLVTLFASRYILPETLFPWVNLVAAALVVAVGIWVARGRLASLRRHLAHRRAHARGLAHDHGPGEGGHGHAHGPVPALAVAGAAAHVHGHHHAHGHGHAHSHGHSHGHGHGHGHGHHHGPGGHSHAPPEDLSMRSLLAVGASAGIIPCPSALVLLLGAIAIGRVGYGLVLVLAFSVGLAGLLSLIGLLVIYARRLIERLPLDGRIASAIPALSALAIIALGAVLLARAIPPLL